MPRYLDSRTGPSTHALFQANFLRLSRVIGGALLLALSAKLQFPVPGTPVPATLQMLAVLLAGGLLGPSAGGAATAIYLAAGLAGAPVFASLAGPAALAGPTGGFLLGFLPAAVLAGLASRKALGMPALFGGFLLATLVVHVAGWAQLSLFAGPAAAFKTGVLPFLAGDTLKALLAAFTVHRVRSRGRGLLPKGTA